MTTKNKITIALSFLLLAFASGAPAAHAKGGNEYNAIVKHLKTKYQAKKVKVPFVWLARLAIKVVRPAGVKSFDVTLFENLNFSRATLDEEMQAAMRDSLSIDWSPIFRVRSRDGQQVYMYMREAGANVKLMLVTIDKNQAAVVRAKFSPEKLAEFIDNPEIFGISLDGGKEQSSDKTTNSDKTLKPQEDSSKQQ